MGEKPAPEYTQAGLLDFLKRSSMAGLINPATARSRRMAAEQLLTQLTAQESRDLRQVDVDELCSRFHKLQGSSIREETLDVYKGRLSAALTDYFSWLSDPDGFQSVGGETRQLRKRGDRAQSRSAEESALEEIKLGAAEIPAGLLPIQIREDCVVFVQNLPLDMTTEEAGKVSRVVLALATDGDKGEADKA